MQIKVELKGVKEAMKILDPKQINKAITYSLNRAARSGKTEASEQIRKGDKPFNLLKSDIDRKISLKAATQNDKTVIITVISDPWLLSYFKPREIKGRVKSVIKRMKGKFELLHSGTRLKNSGVSVEILKGDRNTLSKSFIIQGKGGTPLVVHRMKGVKSLITGKDKLAAPKVYSLPSMFKKPRVIEKVINKIKTQWVKEFTGMVERIKTGKWNIGE